MSHHHSPQVKRALVLRLRKIAGQIKAMEKQIEDHLECTDVLMQAVSARRALKSFSEAVIAEHMEHCIEGARDSRQGQAKMKDLLKVLKRYTE